MAPFTGPPDQLGCVVPDLGDAIAEWNGKGVGPFLTMRGVTIGDYRHRGRPSKPKIDVAFSQQGERQIELIQPLGDEPSAYRDFLDAGGSGPHHRGWFCDDYAAQVDAARAGGRTELQRGRWGALHFVYYDPLDGEQMIGELIEMTDLSRRLFALIRSEAEKWDGKRGSRHLLAAADWSLRFAAARVQLGSLAGRA